MDWYFLQEFPQNIRKTDNVVINSALDKAAGQNP
jgi:hypothetical protein